MRRLVHTLVFAVLALATTAADWPNSGGNPGRNGLTTEVGPSTAAVMWSGSRPSIIAWQPVSEGNRVYMVRQTSMPIGTPGDSPIVCQDLTTGLEQWFIDLTPNTGEWTTWVAGVSHGRLYASRSSYGSGVPAKLHCFDSTTGAPLWMSVDVIDAGAYDGVVFAENGDPIVGSFTGIWRIDRITGATTWVVSRTGGTSGTCGVARTSNAVYAANFTASGLVIARYNLTTGAFQYQSAPMNGFTTQNTPMVGPDGTIYQNVQDMFAVHYYHAWTDNGSAFVPKWNVHYGYTAASESGIGPDGSVYHLAPNNEIHRVNPATGAFLNTTGPLTNEFVTTRFAIDAQGRVFLTNGAAITGILASYNADLTLRWSVSVPGANIGGPILGQNGTLLMAGVGTNVVAYRDLNPATSFCFGDGTGTACPCANSGTSGHGCANSIHAGGGLLQASGIASVGVDSVVLSGSSMPDAATLYFQGTGPLGGGFGTAFGDGLRCAGGTIVRLGNKTNVAGSSQYPETGDLSISANAQIPPAGGLRTYQAWYRNAALFCTPSTFNLTNGLAITWTP